MEKKGEVCGCKMVENLISKTNYEKLQGRHSLRKINASEDKTENTQRLQIWKSWLKFLDMWKESKWLLNPTHSTQTSLWRPQNNSVPITSTGSRQYDGGDCRAVLMYHPALFTEPVPEGSEKESLDGSCTCFIHLPPAVSAYCMRVWVGGTAGAWKTQVGFIPLS